MNTKNTQSNEASGIPKAIETAIRRILRPLVRLLLSFQVTFPVFQNWLKHAYVDIADSEFPLSDKPQTDTRISLLTGIHRKDIKRLRHDVNQTENSPENISIGVQLASYWMGKAEYLDENKSPLLLPFKADGDNPSFEHLVEQVCKKDIRARVVLDEWLRLGIVQFHSNSELIELIPEAFVPQKGIDEKAFFLGLNIADHLSAATNNVRNTLLSAESIHSDQFERCAYYDGLNEDSLNELKQLAAEQGMALLHSLNERALQLKKQQQSIHPREKIQRINIGLYIFDEANSSNAPVPSPSETTHD